MNKEKFERLFNRTASKWGKFINEANAFIECSDIADDYELEKEQVQAFIGALMATGAEIKKPQHMIGGAVIGSVGTLLTVGGVKYFKDKRKKAEVNEAIEDFVDALEEQYQEIMDNEK